MGATSCSIRPLDFNYDFVTTINREANYVPWNIAIMTTPIRVVSDNGSHGEIANVIGIVCFDHAEYPRKVLAKSNHLWGHEVETKVVEDSDTSLEPLVSWSIGFVTIVPQDALNDSGFDDNAIVHVGILWRL